MHNASSPTKAVRFSFKDRIMEPGDSEDEERKEAPRSSASYRSPPPPVPSPTFSGSTESTTGPITPPSPFYLPLSDLKSPASPSTSSSSPAIPKLNPALSGFASLMRWNMDEDPTETIARYELEGDIDEAASFPPDVHLDQMIIVHEDIPDWPLLVEKEAEADTLSVKQVMLGLHQHVLKLVKEEHVMQQSPSRREIIYNSYRRRPTKSVAEGVRRIDYLANRTFLGLRAQEYDDSEGIWVFTLIIL